ncbi:hypothetical protein [Bacillus multifaciens]|uniref:hypothetical protein n=1 Tax=Bacillus multifaciens TaxID=3068506 RepID=UPI002741B647|nr:hypothetical protein [Bacillus sp. WLY-B-L8]MDP7979366.1 hypothetical protein [Bacillus sp. WLY-B-L8]HDX9588100.1 hypothetical protein [Bacillus pseudomycoides]
MGEFKQGILPHWDCFWKDEKGRKFVGMVMFPEKRKRMKEIIGQLKKAYEQERSVLVVARLQNSIQKVKGTIAYFDEESPVFTMQCKDEIFYHIFLSDIVRVEHQE